MPPEKKTRVAVIGRTGKGAYGHGLDVVWLGMDNVEIVAVADENEVGRKAAQQRLKCPTAYADFREMLKKEKPQIVSVADRFLDLHRDMVVACAEHGASIFLEKAVCRNLTEADEMIAACEKHHVKCAVAHQTRYSPRMKLVKQLIADGQIGDILELRGRGKEDARGGGQDLMVLGTHILDLMRYFVGNPATCYSRIWHEGRKAVAGDIREGAEGIGPIQGDQIFAQYGFGNGMIGTFGTHKAKAGVGSRFALFIYGTKGVLSLLPGGLGGAWILEAPSWMPGKSKVVWQEVSTAGIGKPEPIKDGGLAMGNRWIVEDLIAAIAEDRQPLGSLYDGRSSLEMILAVYESHRLEKPVDLPLKNRRHPLM